MIEDNTMPAETPADTQTIGDLTDREDNTMPAATQADVDEAMPAETPAEDDGNEAEQPGRKKLSGAQRAKRREEYMLNEFRTREEHLLSELQERDRRLEAIQAQTGGRSDDDRKRNHSAHLERLKGVQESIADFDAAMSRMAGVPIRDDVIDEIVASDKSPLLAYHLAKNPDKLRELNSMNVREMAREIGRLESSLKMPEGRKQTQAPAPLTILRGGAAPAVDLASASMEAYVAARKRQGFGKD